MTLVIYLWISRAAVGSSADIDGTEDMKSTAGRFRWFDRPSSFRPTPFRAGVSHIRKAAEFLSDMRWLDYREGPSDGHEGFWVSWGSVCGMRLEVKDGDFVKKCFEALKKMKTKIQIHEENMGFEPKNQQYYDYYF